jgi:hypothetical protein
VRLAAPAGLLAARPLAATARGGASCLWIQDVVAELVQLAERIVKVSDAPGRAIFVDLEHLYEHPMAGSRAGRKVPSGHVSCERTGRSAALK